MKQFGKYEVLGTIGKGGMGVVYSARDRQLDRLVALKVLSEEQVARPDHRDRLIREARAIAALHHPNVATIFELGETDRAGSSESTLFLAMEHVQGEDLELRLRQGRLTAEETIDIGLQILAGLQAAHGAGVIHRDLKPGNIRVASNGVVKILDFGLAKLEVAATLVQGAETPVPFQTEEAVVMGTVPYLAPEQARGRTVDPRADLFSVGVILYRVLTGELPFRARNFVDFVLEVEREQPKPLTEQGVDHDLARFVSRMMARDVNDRYESASAARKALEQIRQRRSEATSDGETIFLRRAALGSARRQHIVSTSLIAVVVLAVALFSWLAIRERSGQSQALRPASSVSAPATLRLAILPFANRTGDPDLEHVCQGLAYALSSLMFSIRELQVVDQTISAGYPPSSQGLEQLARDYGVNRVVTGQVLRSNDEVQIQVNLVDPSGGQILASESYNGPVRGLLDLQSSIARGIGENLEVALSLESRRRLARLSTSSSQAFEDRLRALQYLESPDIDDLDVAVFYLRRALESDPDFAAAYADLGFALLLRYQSNRDPDSIREAIDTAEKAVGLDAQLVPAQMTLGRAYRQAGRSKDAAERFRIARALKLEGATFLSADEARLADSQEGAAPEQQVDAVEALLQLAGALNDDGDGAGAEKVLRQAIAEAPEDWRPQHDLGALYLKLGRLEQAETALREADRLAPADVHSPALNLVVVSLYKADYRQAIEDYAKLGSPVADPLLVSNIGTAYYNLEDLDQAEKYYRLAIQLQPGNEVLRGNLGDLLLKRGQPETARGAYAVALSLLDEQLEVFPDRSVLKAYRALYLAKLGRCDEALPLALRAERPLPRSVESPYLLARALSLCGAEDDAILLLKEALEAGFPRVMMADEADFDRLRDRPAFRNLLKDAP